MFSLRNSVSDAAVKYVSCIPVQRQRELRSVSVGTSRHFDSPRQLLLNLALGLLIMKMEVAQMMPQLLYLTPVQN